MTSDIVEAARRVVAARGGETSGWACRASSTATIT